MAGLSNSDKQNLTKEQQAQVAALKEQYAKAQAGKVFTVGDYAFLVIMGRMDHDPAAEVAEIEEKIKGNFDNVA